MVKTKLKNKRKICGQARHEAMTDIINTVERCGVCRLPADADPVLVTRLQRRFPSPDYHVGVPPLGNGNMVVIRMRKSGA